MNKKHTSSLLLVSVLAALGSSTTVSASPKDEYARGRVIVEARAGLSDADLEKIAKQHGGKHRKMGQSRLYVIELPANASETAVVAQLQHRPELKFAELDRVVRSTAVVNDPYLGNEWHLSKVNALTAWDTAVGNGITLAILDSGINVNHPDLKDRLVAGYNFYNNNADVTDVCGHGTAVAGVGAASANNAVGVAGIAGSARIMPVRVAYNDSSAGCYAYYSTIASGLTFAADNGARIANVSYGGVAGSASVQSAARYMKSKGGLVFVSAGNSNIDENITTDGSMVAVSATDSADNKASFSSWGNFVTLSAPGVGIWTTNNAGSYSAWNGTSFASPLSAGVAALIMSARPELSAAQAESYCIRLQLTSALQGAIRFLVMGVSTRLLPYVPLWPMFFLPIRLCQRRRSLHHWAAQPCRDWYRFPSTPATTLPWHAWILRSTAPSWQPTPVRLSVSAGTRAMHRTAQHPWLQ
jgi:thermitase